MQNRPLLQDDALAAQQAEPSLSNSQHASESRVVGEVSEAQVKAAKAHGQEVVIKTEDNTALKLLFRFGAPVVNFFVAQGIKRWVEAYQGPMEDTSFGPYGNSIYDAAMPQMLTAVEAAFLGYVLNTPKFATEEMFATAGAVGAGAFLQGIGSNTQMVAAGINVVGREAVRATAGGVLGYVAEKAGMSGLNFFRSKKVHVTEPEVNSAVDLEAPAQVRFK